MTAVGSLLSGTAALVTGGARGLGRAIVERYAEAGARGLAVDLAPPGDGDRLPEGWLFAEADVREERSLAIAFDMFRRDLGRLDVLVANAGVVPKWAATEALDLAEWDRVFAVNVRGVVATLKLAVPLMKAHGGSIIAMGSVNSWRGHGRQCAYTASKHAVLGIVRAAAQDLGRYGIRVNMLGPGPVATEALMERIEARAAQGGPAVGEVIERYAETALGRMPTLGDVADAALFLASDLSAGLTGLAIPVDAGQI